MKSITILILSFLITGCQTIKFWPDFPPAEESLMQQCKDLGQLPVEGTVTITQLMESVVNNYTLYYQCANKSESWQKWYEKQKKAYDEAKQKSK